MSSSLPLKKNFGQEIYEISPTLSRQLDEMYTDIANSLQNIVRKNVISGSNPPASNQSNSFWNIGDITVRTDTNGVWVMTSRTSDIAVTWTAV